MAGREHEGAPLDDDVIPIEPDLAPTDPAGPAVAAGARPRPRRRSRAEPDVLAVIALGGMAGAAARYGVARWIPARPGGFPWATFWTNLSGSFLLGFLLVLILERFPPTRYLRPFLATGVIGAFTTMSTYEVETALLLKDGHTVTAVVYSVGSLAAGLTLAYAGIVAGRSTPRRSGGTR
jgi:CrcB protein